MRHLRLSRGSMEATTESNLDGSYQPKAAPVLPLLKEHAGQESKNSTQARSRSSERCQSRLVARSQQGNLHGGPGSGRFVKQLESGGRARMLALLRFLSQPF